MTAERRSPEELLRDGERLDDLMNGRVVIQDPKYFCFGIDAVLLAHFPEVRKRDRVMDFCTGSGVIPLIMSAVAEEPNRELLSSENGAFATTGPHFTGIEIQPAVAEMAMRSVLLNGLEDRISIFEEDVRRAGERFGAMTFSLITCNPPYMSAGHGIPNPEDPLRIARHEILISLEEIVRNASFLLKNTGRFAIIHRPQRLAELFALLHKYHLEPKRLRMVHPYAEKEANLVLVEAVKCGKPSLRVEPPLIVYEKTGVYSKEIFRIYGMPVPDGTDITDGIA